MKLTCSFNNSTQVIYRCNLLTKQWIYVYGNTNDFHTCYPLCSNNERNDLLNKYFSLSEQAEIRVHYIQKIKSLRLRCFNPYEKRWKSINYKCGTMTISKYQWFRLHSCFQSFITPTISSTTFPSKLKNILLT
jgi:hypothetical protein